MTELRDQIRDFTLEFESSLPVIDVELITSDEVEVQRLEPSRAGHRRLLPVVAAVVAMVAVVALALLAGSTLPDAPVVDQPDPPTTSVPATTSTTIETEPTLSQAEVLSAVERFVAVINEGNWNLDLAAEMSGHPTDHPGWGAMGSRGWHYGTTQEFPASILEIVHRYTKNGLSVTTRDCEIVEHDDTPDHRGINGDEYVTARVECDIVLDDPVYLAVNGDRIIDWDFLVDIHGHVMLIDSMRSGDFLLTSKAFAEYALLERASEFETACFPAGDIPEGEIWRVQRELRLYMPPDCLELYGELAEEVAAWYEAGGAEHVRRR